MDIVERIEKLLALGKSPNQNESKAAIAKAHQLLQKHNIDLDAERRTRKYHTIRVGISKRTRKKEEYHLSALLQEFYFVRYYWVRTIHNGKVGWVLELSGTESNTKVAEYVWHFILNHIDMEWNKLKKAKRITGRNKKTRFAAGVVIGFGISLLSASPRTAKTGDLIVVGDRELNTYVKNKYSHCRKQNKTTTVDRRGFFSAGAEIGRKTRVRAGVGNEPPRMLPVKTGIRAGAVTLPGKAGAMGDVTRAIMCGNK